MATAICFYSKHHGNTKKLLDAIREAEGSVELIDITEQKKADLSGYDRIGFASGIYYGGSSAFSGRICRRISRSFSCIPRAGA